MLHASNQHFKVVSVNQTLTKRAKHHQRLLHQFTKRWQHEYGLSPREHANERCKKQNKESPIWVGDIVIVKADLKKRTFWKLAKVEELLPGRDGQIQSAMVKVAGKEDQKLQVIRRVIQDLIPVEVSEWILNCMNEMKLRHFEQGTLKTPRLFLTFIE